MPENLNKNLEQKSYRVCHSWELLLCLPRPPLSFIPWHNPPPTPPKKNQIWILCQNSLTRELKIRVVGFVHKKLLTYFEIVLYHMLYIV